MSIQFRQGNLRAKVEPDLSGKVIVSIGKKRIGVWWISQPSHKLQFGLMSAEEIAEGGFEAAAERIAYQNAR